MIRRDVLDALDGLQWLGSGEAVSQRFAISPATVSRHCNRALNTFGLALERRNGEWDLIGDQTFLRLQRAVHQRARLHGQAPLRLEATYWSAPLLSANLPGRWLLGRSDIVGIQRNMQLLQERIIDAWITGLPDLPGANEPELTAIPLTRMPVFFTCAPGHPLLTRERLSYEDIAAYPSLSLPSGCYPLVEQALQAIGLWNDGVRMLRYKRLLWEGKNEADLTIGYGTPLSLAISGGQLQRLPLRLPFDSGDALVVHKDLLRSDALADLIRHVRARMEAAAREHPEIELIDQAMTAPCC